MNFVGTFHGLFYADAEGQFLRFFVIRSGDAVGGGKTGRLLQVFTELGKKFTLEKWNI